MVILENIDIDIDIDKAILQNIDIDKISNRFKFGISNRAILTPILIFSILKLYISALTMFYLDSCSISPNYSCMIRPWIAAKTCYIDFGFSNISLLHCSWATRGQISDPAINDPKTAEGQQARRYPGVLLHTTSKVRICNIHAGDSRENHQQNGNT